MRANWFKTVFLLLNGNTELAQAVDGAIKEDLHFDDQSKQIDFLFCVTVFPKRNRKHVLGVSIEL